MPPPEIQKVEIKSNFLRKRMGYGGSPTEFEQKFREMPSIDDSKGSTQFLVPVRRNPTTIRIRQKNASFVYGEASMTDMNQSQMSQTNMLWEKKRAN